MFYYKGILLTVARIKLLSYLKCVCMKDIASAGRYLYDLRVNSNNDIIN